jgi:hypothetical protein
MSITIKLPPPEEFQFPGLADQEKEVCWRYEYFRENYLRGGKVRDLVVHLRQLDVANNVDSQVLAAALLYDCFGIVEGFPSTPWLKLPRSVRDSYTMLPADFRLETARQMCLKLETRKDVTFEAWRASCPPGAVCGWFMIRPGSRTEMKEQFARELDRVSKENPGLCVNKSSRGADTPTARLKQLGALRLFDYAPMKELMRQIDAKQPIGTPRVEYPYRSEKPFRVARRKALRRLSEIDLWAEKALAEFQQ